MVVKIGEGYRENKVRLFSLIESKCLAGINIGRGKYRCYFCSQHIEGDAWMIEENKTNLRQDIILMIGVIVLVLKKAS